MPSDIKKYCCKVGNTFHCCIIFISLKIKQNEIEQVIFCIKPISLIFFLSFFFFFLFLKKDIALSLFLRIKVNMFDTLHRSHYLFTKKKHLMLSHFKNFWKYQKMYVYFLPRKLTFACSKITIETLEKSVKYVQS